MTGILAFLGTKLGLGLVAGGGLLAGFLGPKMVSKFVGREVANLIGKALNPTTPDPVLKQLIVDAAKANIKLAEYLVPDRGVGQTKKDMVIKALGAIGGGAIPPAVVNALGSMTQEAFDQLDDELKRAKQ